MKLNLLGFDYDLPHFNYVGSETNIAPHWWCGSCGDNGMIEICHPSTDALIGWRNCDCTPPPPVYKWPYRWKLTPAELTAKRIEMDGCPF